MGRQGDRPPARALGRRIFCRKAFVVETLDGSGSAHSGADRVAQRPWDAPGHEHRVRAMPMRDC